MNNQQKNHYKDRNPKDTIEYIQKKLSEIGIQLEENDVYTSSVKSCSLRVQIVGTNIGANGKGVNLLYARASAYAEFMERLQNNILNPFFMLHYNDPNFQEIYDERLLDVKELMELDSSVLNNFFKQKNMENDSPEEKMLFLKKNYKMEYFSKNIKDKYGAIPFFSMKKNKIEYVPYVLKNMLYGSNGMSAGNTPEEALVQGISEIIERFVQKKIFEERPVFPNIPDEYLKKFPYIWECLNSIRNISGIRAYMKDCSFGGRYPVAALVMVNENQGSYGIKLGCHPDYGIAMERCITEAAQGCDFPEYVNNSTFDFNNLWIDEDSNFINLYKAGVGFYPYEFFDENPTYPFVPVKDVSKMTNKQILKMILDEIRKSDYDILIRDVSYTGFPSYHIIIPGISELRTETSDLQLRMTNTREFLCEYVNYPELISKKTAEYLRAVCDFYCRHLLVNTMESLMKFPVKFDYPGDEIGLGLLYMSAMCCYYLKDYEGAEMRLSSLTKMAMNNKSKDYSFYLATMHYMSGRKQGLTHERTLIFLKKLFSKDICDRIYENFEYEKEVFVRQYPRNDYKNKKSEELNLKEAFYYERNADVKMKDYILKHPIDQKNIKNIVGNK